MWNSLLPLFQDLAPIDWGTLIDLAPQSGLVLIFIWFTLERDKRQAEKDAQAQAAFLVASEKRDEQWRLFLVEERQWRGSTMERIADEIKQLTVLVASTNSQMSAHDTNSKILGAEILSKLGTKDPK